MSDEFHPAKLRSTVATLLDALFAGAVVAVLLSAVLNLLSTSAREDMARAYARQFAVKLETDCPTAFGKAFWFTCASEVRRINPPATPPSPPRGDKLPAAPTRAP